MFGSFLFLPCAGVEQRCGHLSPRAVVVDFLSSFTRLGLGFKCRGPLIFFFSDPNTDLFSSPHAVAVVTGRQYPGLSLFAFTRLGLGLHT